MKHSFSKLALPLVNVLLGLAIVTVLSPLGHYVTAHETVPLLMWAPPLFLVVVLLSLWFRLARSRDLHKTRTLKRAPGVSFMALVDFLYSADYVEKTFKPIISDWHKEYFEALATECVWRSRWINVKYRFRFVQVMGLCKAWQLIEKVVGVISSVMSK